MEPFWNGKKVLLTGATRGIGREMARQLGAAGAQVLAVARNPAALEALCQTGDCVDFLEADLADPEIPLGVVNWIRDAHPDCAVLINNAAVMRYPLLTDGTADLAGIEEETRINLIAPMQIAVGLLPVLAEQDESRIVNVTSGLAVAPKADAPVYCATKAAMRSFTRTLRYQTEDAGFGTGICEALLPVVDTTLSRGAPEGKMAPDAAAAAILNGAARGMPEIWIGKARLLRQIMRLSPRLGHGMMRRMAA
ncbi:SDR family NAD(P)-dependent oxidoreductase [Salipiger sp. P9]|uniref:SDR family oxidoreductase n=1 Tax=Salipiger pentaromativorans TaxID=2943193 RepID=UPI00215794C6|nr:SDR family NAD(P)-dependent oxidoreductase [Salipiger pentaromativorans]MCR8549038.1 SDR family NAD(P)-dependent oxidoreductase [Salipiger pentaromativorans]